MIQDIFPKHLECGYNDYEESDNDIVIAIYNGRILVKESKNNETEFITAGEIKTVKPELKFPKRYLFSLDKEHFFLYALISETVFPGYVYKSLKEIRTTMPRYAVLVASTAWHLYNWYADNIVCGRCGQMLLHDNTLRMLKCSCGNQIFPRISPAVIVGVIKGGSILITKYAGRDYVKNALVAGFTEIGETAEETVAREVMEEVGLRVKNITYYKSQPWGFTGTLLLGYFCEVSDDSPIVMDEKELSMAAWIKREDLEEYTEGLSLTGEMMNVFKNGREKY